MSLLVSILVIISPSFVNDSSGESFANSPTASLEPMSREISSSVPVLLKYRQ